MTMPETEAEGTRHGHAGARGAALRLRRTAHALRHRAGARGRPKDRRRAVRPARDGARGSGCGRRAAERRRRMAALHPSGHRRRGRAFRALVAAGSAHEGRARDARDRRVQAARDPAPDHFDPRRQLRRGPPRPPGQGARRGSGTRGDARPADPAGDDADVPGTTRAAFPGRSALIGSSPRASMRSRTRTRRRSARLPRMPSMPSPPSRSSPPSSACRSSVSSASSRARGTAPVAACEELIVEGRVTLNGTVATLGDRADPSRMRFGSTVSR